MKWKNRKEHCPLLLRGARQVGKSYLVEHFGKTHFENLIVIDFEKKSALDKCFKTKDALEIVKQLEVVFQQKILPGKSLLFLDEIQECPDALISLRYFKEEMPDLHVIAAGSLLEFLLNNHKYSFPVGRVEFLYLRPVSFAEFLNELAPIAAERIISASLRSSFLSVEHEEMLKWVRKYLFIGGMPAAVSNYAPSNSFLESQRAHKRILQAYESDFGKYSDNVDYKYLQIVFKKAPALIGQIIKYINIDSDSRSREIKPAIELLTRAGLIHQIFATTASGLPLHAHIRYNRFKLLFLDVGLLQTACQVNAQDFWEKNILQINSGMIAEQFVGQELIAYDDPDQNKPLLFWENEKGGQAEIDYIITIDSRIIPVEVKSGSTGSLRSLQSFMKFKKSLFGVRISEHPLSFHDNILSVPLYLISELPRLVLEVIKKHL